jgi:polyisoprenoid-binding protein YceI
MAVSAGRHEIGTARGQILLHTFRDGVAAQAGHDLTIEVGRWSGELTLNPDLSPASLELRIDLGSLIVREGTGGLKPLSDRDRREIAVTARKVLAADRHPEAVFVAKEFLPNGSGGGAINGTLTLAGLDRPLRLQLSHVGEDKYHATATVVQTEHGIKPYTGFLGALRVRDAVSIDADIDLAGPSGPADSGGAQR